MDRKNKREDILRAAMRVFCFYGYDGATLEKIAGEAGVSKALVIKYYGTLKEMLVICVRRFIKETNEKITRHAAKKGGSYAEHINYVFELYKLARPQLRLMMTVFLTPAHEEITRQLLPACLQLTQGTLARFEDTEDLATYRELNYTIYAQLIAYIMGGSEENYRQARDATLKLFLEYS